MMLPVRAVLGKDAFLTHYTAGQTCPLEQILQEAETVLQNVPTAPGASPAVPPTAPAIAKLSPREREILILVATGLTDIQIAQSLSLSRRTVSKHVQSIYTKLAINSRSAATRLALESGLI
jgi:DNA-binding NarL/FixJ family response regulator